MTTTSTMMIHDRVCVRRVSAIRLRLKSPWHKSIGIKDCFPAILFYCVLALESSPLEFSSFLIKKKDTKSR